MKEILGNDLYENILNTHNNITKEDSEFVKDINLQYDITLKGAIEDAYIKDSYYVTRGVKWLQNDYYVSYTDEYPNNGILVQSKNETEYKCVAIFKKYLSPSLVKVYDKEYLLSNGPNFKMKLSIKKGKKFKTVLKDVASTTFEYTMSSYNQNIYLSSIANLSDLKYIDTDTLKIHNLEIDSKLLDGKTPLVFENKAVRNKFVIYLCQSVDYDDEDNEQELSSEFIYVFDLDKVVDNKLENPIQELKQQSAYLDGYDVQINDRYIIVTHKEGYGRIYSIDDFSNCIEFNSNKEIEIWVEFVGDGNDYVLVSIMNRNNGTTDAYLYNLVTAKVIDLYQVKLKGWGTCAQKVAYHYIYNNELYFTRLKEEDEKKDMSINAYKLRLDK